MIVAQADLRWVKDASDCVRHEPTCKSEQRLFAAGFHGGILDSRHHFSEDEASHEMEGLKCFSCKGALENARAILKDEVWTVSCPDCAVINRLKPHPENPDQFVVTGAFFISHMRDVVAPRPQTERRRTAPKSDGQRAARDRRTR
jgi:hypothetical protein